MHISASLQVSDRGST